MVCNNKKPFIVDIHTNSTRVYYIKGANLNLPHAGEQVLLVCSVDRLGCRYNLKEATTWGTNPSQGGVALSTPTASNWKRLKGHERIQCWLFESERCKVISFYFGWKVFSLTDDSSVIQFNFLFCYSSKQISVNKMIKITLVGYCFKLCQGFIGLY